MSAPLGALILCARHERRAANGGKGFGWCELDGFAELAHARKTAQRHKQDQGA